MKELQESMKALQQQFGKLTMLLTSREVGRLPSNTDKKPKEQLLAIDLRSGKEIKSTELKAEKATQLKNQEKAREATQKEKQELQFNEREAVKKPEEKKDVTSPVLKIVKVKEPYPNPRQKKKREDDKRFPRILKALRELVVNFPLVDAILQMPSFTKMFKSILCNKQKWEELGTLCLTEACSAAIQNCPLPKKKTPPDDPATERKEQEGRKDELNSHEAAKKEKKPPTELLGQSSGHWDYKVYNTRPPSSDVHIEDIIPSGWRDKVEPDVKNKPISLSSQFKVKKEHEKVRGMKPNPKERKGRRRRRRSSCHKGNTEGKCMLHAPTSKAWD